MCRVYRYEKSQSVNACKRSDTSNKIKHTHARAHTHTHTRTHTYARTHEHTHGIGYKQLYQRISFQNECKQSILTHRFCLIAMKTIIKNPIHLTF